MEKSVIEKNRIHLLDEIRGFAVLFMVIYHSFYIFADFYGFDFAAKVVETLSPAALFVACLFIGICGFCCNLSRNNFKRGAVILGMGLGVTLVTAVIMPLLGFIDCEIWFGILHFLGVAVLLFALISKLFTRINGYAGVLVSLALFIFFFGIEKHTLGFGGLLKINLPDSLYTTKWLVPFGIYPAGFFSADYFPILPFIFMFFVGAFIGIIVKAKGFGGYAHKKRVPPLSFLGRHALIVYIIHIPIIAGIGYIIDFAINH